MCSLIAREKSVFKIVTKTKNEAFFIERWIQHHLPMVGDSRIVIFDNMSSDKHVINIYKKYRKNILLIHFDGFMDRIHMAEFCMPIYEALSNSAEFFTIIDSDEYLYLYNGDGVVHDNFVTSFLRENADANFFPTCWMDNIHADARLFRFNPQNARTFHLGKPIVNARIIHEIGKYSHSLLHHTKDLPLSAYGRAPTCFLLLHLKNLDRHQRIRANMEKLAAFKIIRHCGDFEGLLRLDADALQVLGHLRDYIDETKKLVKNASCRRAGQNTGAAPGGTLELLEGGALRFMPQELEGEFKRRLGAASDYFDLIACRPDVSEFDRFTTIQNWLVSTGRY
ncbi:MAG: glycosyltransferase family 2 protein [Desulfovibrio sp.]|nr:glycosyltransferase family 2 protein [Desulfovibrio sp.]